MRGIYGFLLVAFFALCGGRVMGQTGMDTLGLTGGMGDTVVARKLFSKSIQFNGKDNFTEALVMVDSAIQIWASTTGINTKEMADALHQKGRNLSSLDRNEEALLAYQRSLKIRVSIFGLENIDVAQSYNNIGHVFEKEKKYEKAIENLEKALKIRLLVFGYYHPDVAFSYVSLGLSYHNFEDYDKATEYYKKALEIRINKLGYFDSEVAKTYDKLGNVYALKGENDKSTECYTKALNIWTNIFGLEDKYVSYFYNNLGVVYNQTNNFQKAIEYFEKALLINKKILGESNPDLLFSYTNLAISYHGKGDFGKAIQYCENGLKIASDSYGPENYYTAVILDNLGACYSGQKNYIKSIECYDKSLLIYSKLTGEYQVGIAGVNNNLGMVYACIGELDKARVCQNKSLTIKLKILGDIHPDVAISYNNLGDINYLSNNMEEAFYCYSKALIACSYENPYIFDNINNVNALLLSLSRLKDICIKKYNIYFDVNDLLMANSYIRQATSALGWQAKIQSDIDQNIATKIYEGFIAVSIQLAHHGNEETYIQEIFPIVESTKSILLRQAFAESLATRYAGIPDSIFQNEQGFRESITWREKQRQSLLDKGLSETDTNTLRISSIIFDLKNNYEALKKRLEKDYPEYYRLKYDLSTVSLAYVQDTLLTQKQTLLEYFVGDSSIYLFVVRPDTMIVKEVKRDFPLEDWIEQFRHGLYGFYSLPDSQQTDALKAQCRAQYLEYAPKLYQKLFAPIEDLLTEKEAVIIVPDGPLGYIPFDALLTGAPKVRTDFKSYPYLLNKYQFSYTYSATLLREMRDKKHHHEPLKAFAAFAPFYTGDTLIMMEPGSITSTRQGFKPLPYSKVEVNGLHKMMGGDVVAGAYATEQRFVDIAGDYRILHLATHGVADNRVGDYAYLAFSEINDSIENEMLYVKDLYNLELNADLVVLSACETGVGKLQRGEGIISLARAFAYAGAKSIVTSLWSVSDQSTSELMTLFYKELKTGKTKDKALHDARLEYLKAAGVKNSHPFFWAAFVPVGDMRATAGGRR